MDSRFQVRLLFVATLISFAGGVITVASRPISSTLITWALIISLLPIVGLEIYNSFTNQMNDCTMFPLLLGANALGIALTIYARAITRPSLKLLEFATTLGAVAIAIIGGGIYLLAKTDRAIAEAEKRESIDTAHKELTDRLVPTRTDTKVEYDEARGDWHLESLYFADLVARLREGQTVDRIAAAHNLPRGPSRERHRRLVCKPLRLPRPPRAPNRIPHNRNE